MRRVQVRDTHFCRLKETLPRPEHAVKPISAVWLCCTSQGEPMPRHLAGFIARFASTANLWPLTVDRARCRNADLTDQSGATVAVALHASKMLVDEHAGDAIEVAIDLGGEPGPVARIRAASPAASTERSCVR